MTDKEQAVLAALDAGIRVDQLSKPNLGQQEATVGFQTAEQLMAFAVALYAYWKERDDAKPKPTPAVMAIVPKTQEIN